MRVLPYTWATLAGLLPGTAAVVILGDALTNHISPMLILVSLFTASLGVAGLIYEIRTYPQHHRCGRRGYPLCRPGDCGGPSCRCCDSGGYCIGGSGSSCVLVSEAASSKPGTGLRASASALATA